jgi:hypothetical protein
VASGPTIVAKFMADTSNLTSEVDKASSGASSKIASFAKGAAIALGGAFAVTKIVEFGKASVEAAAADAEAQAQLAAALRNTAGATDAQIASAETFISNLSKQAAIADDDLRPALATLARGFGDTEQAQRALAIATDVSAGTGKSLSTVTEAMMKAANGQTGALGRLGIATKNADGSAKSLNQIMSDMATTFQGQAAVAADSTAGRMRNAKIQFGEFQEQIGTALLPVIGKLASLLSTTLLPALSGVFDFIASNQAAMIAAIVAISGMFLIWAANAGIAAAATIAAIAPVIAAAAPFIALGAAVAALAYLIVSNWDTIVAATRAAWDAVVGAVRTAFNWIRDNWPLILAIITGPIGAAVALVVKNWDTIKAAAMAVYNWIRDNWPLLLAILTGPIGAAVLTITRNWDTIKQAATDLYNWVAGKFQAIGDAISNAVSAISGAVGRVVNTIKSPINALIDGWNRLSFGVPRVEIPKVHIPGTNIDIGGGGLGPYTFDFPNIPRLATGAVLTSPTLFLGGEAGTEVVAPEALLRAIVAEEAGGHYTLNMYPRTADAADIAYGFRRLELLAGVR